ncbi:natural resistance-associated macrophage protein-domain-containing protein [Roridomyces roridus]|uniref:Natural resistance-associated macrophage protein-domain-containing protein n=1 Tax=Roridomyces roridus TaxID=1738132 RepID=A0AAD7FCL7_9AGAR|nr:natural resistance-associated macrophage protein-domain-containing protein [Roridomyces roridus]
MADSHSQTSSSNASTLYNRLKSAGLTVVVHATKHAGVGVVCAVAYFDPGNWGVDLEAGSRFGYKLLVIVLVAGIIAVFLQVLATRLGCVTGLDLASHCRVLLHDRPKHTRLYRWLGLYPLYLLSEVAIIATDLAELLGTAIALCLLFPRLEIWHGVLITTFDVVILLAFRDPLRSTPVKMFEILIGTMVLAVLICMVIVITKVDVDWAKAFEGFLPSSDVFRADALYTSVGILGATVMPHSLFLGSALSTQDRLTVEAPSMGPSPKRGFKSRLLEFSISLFRTPAPSPRATRVKNHADRENNSLTFIRAHLSHNVVDVVGSLLGFAVVINSMHVSLSKVFSSSGNPATLFDAYDIIRNLVGQSAATLFALSLLASGQSASIIATVAGQAVSEGFLNWRVSPIVRRLLTRLIAVIPSMVVAVAVGRPGISTLLVASQVVLSIVLPFITLPLIYLTSSRNIMRVRKSPTLVSQSSDESPWDDSVDYSSGFIVTAVGCCIWLLILTANLYVIVTLILGAGH